MIGSVKKTTLIKQHIRPRSYRLRYTKRKKEKQFMISVKILLLYLLFIVSSDNTEDCLAWRLTVNINEVFVEAFIVY